MIVINVVHRFNNVFPSVMLIEIKKLRSIFLGKYVIEDNDVFESTYLIYLNLGSYIQSYTSQ